MPLTIAALQAEEREFDFPYLGEQVHATYRPGQITSDKDALPFREWIPAVVTSWDLVGLDGEPYPLVADELAKLPDAFLAEFVKGVLRDSRLDPTTSRRSADG